METNDGEIARDVHGLSRLYRGLGLLTGKFIDACTQFEEWRRRPLGDAYAERLQETKSLSEALEVTDRISNVEIFHWALKGLKDPTNKEYDLRCKLAKARRKLNHHTTAAEYLSRRTKQTKLVNHRIDRHNKKAVEAGLVVSGLEATLNEYTR